MNLHFAGADGSSVYNELLISCGVKNRLESFATLKKKCPSKGFNLLVDSGGFVARNKGHIIKVEDYANFLKQFKPSLAFELDVATKEETLDNRRCLQQEIKDTTIIPVYHYSEFEQNDFQYLYDMMDNYSYISIGGVAARGLNSFQIQNYLNFVFKHTRDKWKVHGLGITDSEHLKLYPFFSVDSTSWLAPGRFAMFKSVRDKDFAFFLSKERNYIQNTRRDIIYFIQTQEYITKLWNQKGICWHQ